MADDPEFVAALFGPILEVLRAHPDGISEYDLIGALDSAGQEGFDPAVFRDPLTLFECHFLLFHTLYRLRDRLHAERAGDLRIDCMRVQLLAPLARDAQPLAHDEPLRRYYLDLSQLTRTSAQDVRELLEAFWRRFAGYGKRESALEVLGVDERADFDEIKRAYRRLAMEHHPDRGGDTERLQEINQAMDTLARWHR